MKFRQMRPSSFISSIGPWHPVDASGGVESTITVGSIVYKLHVFYNIGSDTLVINDSGTDGTVEYLVVAGGGGGGMDMGGGGGGGGVLMGRHTVVSGSSMAVTVGSGGFGAPGASQKRSDGGSTQPGAHQYTIPATSGGNSVFGSYTAIGGGFGGSSYRGYTPGITGGAGGSGGGASGYNDNAGTFSGGAGTSGQGFAGGNSTAAYYSGGGGGAGGPGISSTAQPHGGPGVINDILGTSYYWAGGGGGSSYSLATGGNGGNGGGGGGALGTTTGGGSALNVGGPGLGGSPNSWANTRGGSAGVNTGGGGGGGSHYNATNSGGEGGSGIVVVRYPINRPIPAYVTTGLRLMLDASNPASYPGSGTTWYDLSGNANNATLVNGPSYSTNDGGIFVFDGSNDAAQITNSATLTNLKSPQGGSGYTFMIWAKSINATGTWRKLIGNADGENYFDIYQNPTGYYAQECGSSLFVDGTSYANGAFLMSNAGYHCWAGTNTNGGTTSNPSSLLTICNEPNLTSYPLSASVGVVLIYGRVLSSLEISQNLKYFGKRFGL